MNLSSVFLLTLSFLGAMPCSAQTRLEPYQVRWEQVDFSPCRPAAGGTAVKIWQLRAPSTSSSECWPLELARSAWDVITPQCTRCHGADLVAGEVRLVGGLDLRTRDTMLRGGSRGPALIPGDLSSLVYRFIARRQPPDYAPDSPEAFARMVEPSEDLAMPPFFPPDEASREAVRAWVAAGAPPEAP